MKDAEAGKFFFDMEFVCILDFSHEGRMDAL
jgi:hypothetical protein